MVPLPGSESARKAVIIIGTGHASKPYFEICEGLNILTVGVDRNPCNAPGNFHIAESTYDFVRVERACRRLVESEGLTIVGVLSRSSGPAVLTLAGLVETFGVLGVSQDLARACVSKKELSREGNLLSIPSPRVLEDPDELNKALLRGTSVVVKPDIPIIGKRGISVVSTPGEVANANALAAENSFNHEALTQEYVPGSDVFLVTHVRGPRILWHAFFEERVGYSSGKFFNEGLSWGKEIDENVASRMVSSATAFLTTNPGNGTVVFSFRHSRASAFLYEVNVGLVGDGLFDYLWPMVWPTDNPFLREVRTMIGLPVVFPNKPGIPSEYRPQNR